MIPLRRLISMRPMARRRRSAQRCAIRRWPRRLRAIAANPNALYAGEIPADIVKAVGAHPNAGRLAVSDFTAYQVKQREPICTDYKQWRVCGFPPPSSGGIAVAQMLGDTFGSQYCGLPPRDDGTRGKLELSSDAVHLFAEAGRLAFADRALYVADSDFVKVNVAGLLDPSYLKQRAQLIGDRSMGTAKARGPAGTTHRSGRRLIGAQGSNLAHLGGRQLRQCAVNDHDDRGRVRSAHDGARFPAEQ